MADSRRNSKSQDPLRVLREQLALGVTGCLSLRDKEGAELSVYVMQGELLASNGPEDSRWIVRRLVNNGALTETQGERLTARLAAGDRLEDMLFGQVPDDLLLDTMAARFRQSVLDFLFVSALPTFEPMEAIFVDNIQVGHDSQALLAELEGRRDRVRGLRARAPGVTIRHGRGRPRSLDEARILDLCESSVRLADLIASSPMEQGETLDIVHTMLGAGLLIADGFFPTDDDEPTEVSGSELGLEGGEVADDVSESVEPWTEDGQASQVVNIAPIDDWATPLADAPHVSLTPDLEVDDEPLVSAQDAAPPTPEEEVLRAVESEHLRAIAEETHRQAAEEALRAEMERELSWTEEEEGGAPKVIPPGFDFFAAKDEDQEALFIDHDRTIGRGAGEGMYSGGIRDVVDLGPGARAPKPDDDGIIEADSLESLSDEERAQVRALSFGAPPVEESEIRAAFDVVNQALREIARVLDEQNGAGAGRAFVQLLIEGTPAEFSPLFRGVEARKDGRLPIEGVLRNLRDRPKAEHRQLVHRGVEDLMERALTLSCEELDDDAADALAERVLGLQKQLEL